MQQEEAGHQGKSEKRPTMSLAQTETGHELERLVRKTASQSVKVMSQSSEHSYDQ